MLSPPVVCRQNAFDVTGEISDTGEPGDGGDGEDDVHIAFASTVSALCQYVYYANSFFRKATTSAPGATGSSAGRSVPTLK